MKLNSKKTLLSVVACVLCLSMGAQTVEESEVGTAWKDVAISSFNFSSSVTIDDWYVALDKTYNVVRVNRYKGSETEVVVPDTFTYNGVEYVTVGLGNSLSDTWQYNYNNGYKYLKSVTLPSTLRFLGSYAFYYCQGLTEISIPSSVESIGTYAFDHCTSLKSLTIPASVTSVESNAFYQCTKLRTLYCEALTPPTLSSSLYENIRVAYVPESCGDAYEAATYWKNLIIVDGEGVALDINVETPGTFGDLLLAEVENLRDVNYLTLSGTLNDDDIYNIRNRMTGLLTLDMSKVAMTALPNNMFDYRYALQQVVLPENLESIGQYAFRDCYDLQDIVFPYTLESIGNYAFEDCDNFKDVIIPEGVTSIGTYAFYGCDALQTVQWPSTTVIINDCMFYQSSIESIVIPEGVTAINSYAFYESKLKELVCPSTLKSINYRAFYNCDSLAHIEFNEGLESLGKEAFGHCGALTEITLPTTLDYCYYPFYYCNEIKEVTCLALLPPTLEYNYDILYNVNKENCVLYVPEWTIHKYKLAVGWDEFPTIEPIQGHYPENISIKSTVSLTLPDSIPDNYKPNLTLGYYETNQNYGALTLDGSNELSVGKFHMVYDSNIAYYNYYAYNYTKGYYNSLINNVTIHADSVAITSYHRNDVWTFLSFPYDVKVSDIVPLYDNTNYVIRKYSGKDRAEANFSSTWQDMTVDSILRAGDGYIWQSSRYDNNNNWQEASAFIVPAVDNANKNLIFTNGNHTVALNEYVSEFSHNRSWNLIGNPYPCYYDTRAMDFTAPITVWNPYYSTYYAYSPVDDAYILCPGEAFFVQRPVDAESITFAADGRQTDRVVRERTAQAKAFTRSATTRQVFNLTLSDGEMTDRTRFVINPNAAQDYDISMDASKFMSSDARISQLYTVEGGVQFAINERPMGNGTIVLGAYFGSKGSYTIALDTKIGGMSVVLVDKVAGTETNLMESDYTFIAEAGVTDNRFEVCMKADEENGDATDMDNLSGKVSVKAAAGQIAVTAPCEADIEVYNAEGRRIATATATSATFDVEPGVYMVKVQDTVHKVSATR